MLVKIFITGYRSVQDEGFQITYTVFNLDVYVDGIKHTVEKRYTEFEDLHKCLKHRIAVPPFPPKKIRNKSAKVLDQRRIMLENYLQGILHLDNIPEELLQFLAIQVDQLHSRVTSANNEYEQIHFTESGLPSSFTSQHTIHPFMETSIESQITPSASEHWSCDIITHGLYTAMAYEK